ncbi:hypothetical protein T11_11431 [Trichinella zimbabwensis]|uniref:Uncharacterized protein n=1 Tax=Trichinella zimbabwensis TaxID=268475 RepID=A0A0V1HSQ2_9BILA|nr:hypothetical protein T11_11431 [Trichinella zimbabwensis]
MSTHEKDSARDSAGKGPRMEKDEYKSRKRESSATRDHDTGAKERRMVENVCMETEGCKFIIVYDINGFEFKWPEKYVKRTSGKNRIKYSYNLNFSRCKK